MATCTRRGRQASDFERQVEEIGGTDALLHQYSAWGLAAPFIQASFRPFF